jgi:2'-5' RNA ligase
MEAQESVNLLSKFLPARSDGTTTIGIAIGLPEPFATQIQTARERFGDPQANFIPTHITLLPPTEIGFQELIDIDNHLTDTAADMWPFKVQLRGAATFRPVSQVVFLPLIEGISGCERLERAIRKGPLTRRRKFPYHPHVTLVHELSDEVLDQAFEEFGEFRAMFVTDRFSLYQQSPVGDWKLIKDYRLHG